jgi:putative ABC transport system substrate-binding protein
MPGQIQRHLLAIAACALAAAAHAQPAAPRLAPQVVIVGDNAAAPYEAAVAEIGSLAHGAGIPVLRSAEQVLQRALQMGTLGRTDVFVALGARAAAQVLALAPPVRALSCLTIEHSGLPGVILAHSASSRIALVKRMVPKAKVVGVLFDPRGPREDIAALEAAAGAAQLELVAKPVAEVADIDAQLDRLANEVDVLLTTYDLRIHSPKNAAQLIRFSYQHRIPLIGMSDSWTRAGALASLDWDYKDLGAQCASKALRMARGERFEQEPQRPRRQPYSINSATARQLRVQVPGDVAQGARFVFH